MDGALSLTRSGESYTPRTVGLRRGRTVGVVSLVTFAVAALGYLREAALAARFGVSASMDAYFAALFVPSNIYLILVVGTLSPLFIPIILEDDLSEGRAKASETFSIVTTFVLFWLIMLVSLAMITADKWLPLVFPGFDPATNATAVNLTRILFPAIIFLGWAGILGAVLNGFHKFVLPAIAPALSSVAVIAAVMLAPVEKAIYLVGIATTVGFVAQFVILIPVTASLGIHYRPVLKASHPAIKRLLRLGGPLLLYLVVSNASALIERSLASSISTGAVSCVSYAIRLFALPANFLAAPLATVLYPHFAREATRDKYGDLQLEVSRSLRFIVFLFLPITVWIIVNALPITRVLYERGQFVAKDSLVISRVWILYAIGILPNAAGILLLRCFYAIKDTVTPLVAEVTNLGFYAVVATLLTRRFGLSGLAVTKGMSFFVVALILLYVLGERRRLLNIDWSLLSVFLRTAVASLVMGGVSRIALLLVESWLDPTTTSMRAVALLASLIAGGASFFGVALLLRLDEARHVLASGLEMVGLGRGLGFWEAAS
jgi:putative peptidoglycan lipid II flippase